MVEISPPTELADWIGGGFCLWWRFYMLPTVIPPLILTKFEHELWYGGGSGDGGGILAILLRVQFLFRLALQNHKTPS